MLSRVFTTRLGAAFPALRVVGGVEGAAAGAGVVPTHVRHPALPPLVADLLQALPELYSVRPLRLERLQLGARELRAGGAELDAVPGGAGGHVADPAVGAALLRAAAMAFYLFLAELELRGQTLEPFRLFASGDVQGTSFAE